MQILKNIGYFSLIGGYKTPFIDPMTRVYQCGTTFDDIYALYRFDSDLRELVFKYICIVEQKIRQLISYSFCQIYGEQQAAYLTPSNYTNLPRRFADVQKLIGILTYQANTNNEHRYIVHQRTTYQNVPLWVLVNTLTFGQISKFYTLLPFAMQSSISREYKHVNERQLEQYLKVLTLFRNVCAHNERLFSFRTHIDFPDTDLHRKLQIPKNGNQYLYGKRDLFGIIIAFRYLFASETFICFKKSLKRLLRQYTNRSTRLTEAQLCSLMGFPLNWEKITRYQI